MLTAEENRILTEVAAGTPMGELLRRYWYPVAIKSELDLEPTKWVRLLGESLVLYRDLSGNVGLIAEKCVHRRASLIYGAPEPVGLRCMYHGWVYDHTGRCLETPAEDMEGAESTFKDRVRITAYPVQELGGLIWAYLGPQPAPLLPRWEPLVLEHAVRSVGTVTFPCHWLQIAENNMDPVHVEWLHRRFDNYVLQRNGRSDLKHDVWHHAKMDFEVFEYGIIKKRMWQGGSEEDTDWTIGHPILFPNIQVGGQLQIRVPMDETNTWYLYYRAKPTTNGAPVGDEIRRYEVPLPGLNDIGHPRWGLLDNNSGQDSLACFSQGMIADRTQEKLASSDRGIILFRKLLFENIEKVKRGEDPMGVIRDPARNVCIHIATEEDGGGSKEEGLRNVGDRKPTGSSGKYDPLLAGATS